MMHKEREETILKRNANTLLAVETKSGDYNGQIQALPRLVAYKFQSIGDRTS
jgi:hypothetical protein